MMQHLTTPSEPEMHPPAMPPPLTPDQQLAAVAQQCAALIHVADRLLNRVTRMETRLVRFMNAYGLDADGNDLL